MISGKDKGKTGSVVIAFPKKNQVIIDGVNVVTKHQRNRRSRSQGQVIKKSAPIDVSNVALVEGKKAVRVGKKKKKTGDTTKKVRVARPSGKKI